MSTTTNTFKQECPSCGTKITIRNPNLIGRKIDCPKCKYRFTVESPADLEEDDASDGKEGAKKGSKKGGKNKESTQASKSKVTLYVGVGIGVLAIAALILGLVFFLDDEDGGKKGGNNQVNNSGGNKGGPGPRPGGPNPPTGPNPGGGGGDTPSGGRDITNMLLSETDFETSWVASAFPDQLLTTPAGVILFDRSKPLAIMAENNLGFALDDIDRIVASGGKSGLWSLTLLKLKKSLKESDLIAPMGLGAPVAVKSRKYYPVMNNEFFATVGNFFTAQFKDLGLTIDSPADGRKLAMSLINERTVALGDVDAIKKLLELDAAPRYLTEVYGSTPPSTGGNMGMPPYGMAGGPPMMPPYGMAGGPPMMPPYGMAGGPPMMPPYGMAGGPKGGPPMGGPPMGGPRPFSDPEPLQGPGITPPGQIPVPGGGMMGSPVVGPPMPITPPGGGGMGIMGTPPTVPPIGPPMGNTGGGPTGGYTTNPYFRTIQPELKGFLLELDPETKAPLVFVGNLSDPKAIFSGLDKSGLLQIFLAAALKDIKFGTKDASIGLCLKSFDREKANLQIAVKVDDDEQAKKLAEILQNTIAVAAQQFEKKFDLPISPVGGGAGYMGTPGGNMGIPPYGMTGGPPYGIMGGPPMVPPYGMSGGPPMVPPLGMSGGPPMVPPYAMMGGNTGGPRPPAPPAPPMGFMGVPSPIGPGGGLNPKSSMEGTKGMAEYDLLQGITPPAPPPYAMMGGNTGAPPAVGYSGGPPMVPPYGMSGGPPMVPPYGMTGGPPYGMIGGPPYGMTGGPSYGMMGGGMTPQGGSTLSVSRSGKVIVYDLNLDYKKEYPSKVQGNLRNYFDNMGGKIAMMTPTPAWHRLPNALKAMVQSKKDFPYAAYPRNAGGKYGFVAPPEHRVSWMVELLPHLGYEGVAAKIDRSGNWDSPKNLIAGATWIPEFLDPSQRESSWRVPHNGNEKALAATHFVGVAGVGEDAAEYPDEAAYKTKIGAFGYNRQISPERISKGDGLANTALMIQVPNTAYRPWIRGGGATVQGAPETNSIKPFLVNSGSGEKGTHILMADGSIRFVTSKVSDNIFKALLTVEGGEKIDNLDQVAPSVGKQAVIKADPMENPAPVEPKKEEPKKEEPKKEEPKKEEPKATEPKKEEPKATEPKKEEPEPKKAVDPAPADKKAPAEEKPVQIRALDVKKNELKEGLKLNGVEVTDAEGLKRYFKDETVIKDITSAVDFKKERVVLFAWSGSGGDKMSFQYHAEEKIVNFFITTGLTDDLRHHLKIFVVPVGLKIHY
jgi:hypothetical protein